MASAGHLCGFRHLLCTVRHSSKSATFIHPGDFKNHSAECSFPGAKGCSLPGPFPSLWDWLHYLNHCLRNGMLIICRDYSVQQETALKNP